MEKCFICLVCNEEHDMHHIKIKGEIKKICKGCAEAIKGFV